MVMYRIDSSAMKQALRQANTNIQRHDSVQQETLSENITLNT